MAAHTRQAVLLFDEGTDQSMSPRVRGGKGAGLADMAALGLPVPPGFTITTTISRAYAEHSRLPKRLGWQLQRGITKLEQATGKGFGNPDNPLLLSVRSGAPVSMPGMMETILNLGITTEVVQGLAYSYGREFADDTFARFLRQTVDQPRLRSHPMEQLEAAIEAVLESWNSDRARAYRESQDIPGWWGTAVTVQAMVFGNRDHNSGTGVVFSHDVTTGRPGLYGEFLPNAQGEDVVSGTRSAQPIAEMQDWQPAAYEELSSYVELLANHAGAIVDVEFTMEQGKLFILQYRKATRTPQAAATFAVHKVWAKQWSHEDAVASVTPDELRQLQQPAFDPEALAEAVSTRLLARGLPASNGAVVGELVETPQQAQEWAKLGRSAILVRQDTTPDDFEGMLAAKAIVTAVGGTSCHAAVVARGLGIPAVVGTGDLRWKNTPGYDEVVSVDGASGVVVRGKVPLVQADHPKEVNIFLRWADKYGAAKPELNFGVLLTRQSVNQILKDFYLTDEMATAAVGTALESQARTLRNTLHRDSAVFLATYLAVATLGEARHFWEQSEPQPEVVQEPKRFLMRVYAYGQPQTLSRDYYQQMVIPKLDAADLETQIEFVQALVQVYRHGAWRGSYGGEAWARIADALLGYLNGTLTATLFVDRVFDLRHNGGRLFDKHPAAYQNTDEHQLQQQLDVKRRSSGVVELYTDFTRLDAVRGVSHGFSPETEQLYNIGLKQGLW